MRVMVSVGVVVAVVVVVVVVHVAVVERRLVVAGAVVVQRTLTCTNARQTSHIYYYNFFLFHDNSFQILLKTFLRNVLC